MDHAKAGLMAAPTSPSLEHLPETHRLDVVLTSFIDNEQLSDVTLSLQCADQSASIHAHCLVLVASSSYFASALSEPWSGGAPDGRKEEKRSLTLRSEESLKCMRTFIEFLYGKEVELTLGSTHPLLRLADFYGVDKLSDVCLDYLERVLHPEPTRCFHLFAPSDESAHTSSADGSSAVDTTSSSPELDAALGTARPPALLPPTQPKLLALCTEVLARSFSDASTHSSFLRCPTELLLAVLERDDLSVDGEEQVLSALLRWAACEADGRAAELGPLLPLIRWPMMDGETLADMEDSHPLLATDEAHEALKSHLLEAFKYKHASEARKQLMLREADMVSARRFRPRTPNMVRLQGEGKFAWSLKNFSRLSADERIYSPPFRFSGIAFMLLFFPRGNQQREYVSLYVSVADKTKLQAGWRREVHFSLCVVDQKESLCSVTKSTHGELSNQVLDWGFTELMPLSTLHSPNHGYILDDTLQFTIQFERVSEGSVSGRHVRSASQ